MLSGLQLSGAVFLLSSPAVNKDFIFSSQNGV